MKRALAILLMMLTLTLWGAEPSARVAPAPLEIGEKLELYSYTFLGIEVRAFSDEEFAEYQSRLAPVPEPVKGTISRKAGQPAFLSEKSGLLITRVVPGSPAEVAGLKEGELIMTIGGAPMKTPANLLSVMRNCQPEWCMHMLLIDSNLRWKFAQPRLERRAKPEPVGHIIPRRLCEKHLAEMRQRQARVIELLDHDTVSIKHVCDEMERICRILYKGYTPGCLCLPLRTSGGCTITATRFGWNVEVVMQEAGVETRCTLVMYHYKNPEQELNFVLPEAMRQRLREIDISGVPAPAPARQTIPVEP